MQEKSLLEEMAKIISEIQTINTLIDDARTNRIARIRYQKFKPRLRRLAEAHKKLTKQHEAPIKEINPCTNQSLAMKT
jgi:hypothetical protein